MDMSLLCMRRICRMNFIAAGLALSAALSVASPCLGQFGEAAGIAESMQPDYFRRDILILVQGLKLDDTQRIIVDALFSDYEEAFETGKDGVKLRFEEMRPELQADANDSKRVLRLIFLPFKEWGVQKTRLGDEFLENVKVVLTDDQLVLWPAVERQLYRDKHLHKGRLAGENLNHFHIVRDLQLDERSAVQVQGVMEAYDIALDEALRRRDTPKEGVNVDMLDSMSDEDSNRGFELMQQHIALQVAVRNVNDEYIDRV